jgi:phytoene/squalene synthetase
MEQPMPNSNVFSNSPIVGQDQPDSNLTQAFGKMGAKANLLLPELITKAASKQTYYTIRFLVDRDRVLDAFRAYAYFRWVDDHLDEKLLIKSERQAFVERQQALMNGIYHGEALRDVVAEEKLLVELIGGDQEPSSGLQSYIRNMMAVMAFDANRRGRLISQQELTQYSRYLSIAVTEALHYFIGHDVPSPQTPTRYLAVMGAHITHMLRDTFADVASGYFNVPHEFLDTHNLDPCDLTSDSYKVWVKDRTQLARTCFKEGRDYLAQVKNLRCRFAGYAYTARFEEVLNAIEHENYQLRPTYLQCKRLSGGLRMSWSMFSILLKELIRGKS